MLKIERQKPIKVALLIPGFIKGYHHIANLQKLLKNEDGIEFFVFGYIFDYMIPPNISKDKITYDGEKLLDKKIISNFFTDVQYVDNDNYKKYDSEGFDNRIYSQWFNVKKSLELAQKSEHKFDVMIRARSDLMIQRKQFYDCIIKSIIDDVIYFGNQSCHVINDCLIIGCYSKMERILNLSDNYYEYLLLPEFQKLQKEHHSRQNPSFCKHLHVGRESERLLWHHINQVLEKNDYFTIKNFWSVGDFI